MYMKEQQCDSYGGKAWQLQKQTKLEDPTNTNTHETKSLQISHKKQPIKKLFETSGEILLLSFK